MLLNRYFFTLVFSFRILALFSQNNLLESGIGSLNLTGCSLSGGSIKISGTGNIQSNKAFFSSETVLEEIDMTFNVRIDSLNPSGDFLFGIGKYSQSFSGPFGTLVEFSGTDSTSNIIINRLDGVLSIYETQIPIPFNLAIGVDYKIRVGKRIRKLLIEIESSTGTNYFFNDSLSYPASSIGYLWGTPFIGCKTGVISVSDFSLSTPFSLSPRLAVWGDSFIEGAAMGNDTQRYVSLIKDSIGNQNVARMGRGGENSTKLVSRFSLESKWFADSKYALLAVGVNDTNFIIWKNNTLNYIDTLKKRGIVPIISTLSPRSDRLPFIALANNWIRTVYNGAYIDLNKAVSNNETNWTPGLGMTDSIHPSILGNIAIYERIKLEAPYIFRTVDAFTIDFFNEITFENISGSIKHDTLSDFSTSAFGNNIPISVIPGQTIFFKDSTTTLGINSLFDILAVPKRPEKPIGATFDSIYRTMDWTNNTFYLNTSDYEYSTTAGTTWSTCITKPMYLDPSTNSFQLRIKATASNFKSDVLFLDSLITAPGSNITVFPNPFIDKLIVNNITEETLLKIYAADGREVETMILSAYTNEINTDNLRSGFYILTLKNNSIYKSYKVIKK